MISIAYLTGASNRGRNGRGGRQRRGKPRDDKKKENKSASSSDEKVPVKKQDKKEVNLVPAKQPSVNAWGSTSSSTSVVAQVDTEGKVWPTLDATVEVLIINIDIFNKINIHLYLISIIYILYQIDNKEKLWPTLMLL